MSGGDAAWYFDHPEFQKLRSYGKASDGERAVAFRVYMDLCEAKKWCNVQLKYSEELNIIYLTGRNPKCHATEAILSVTDGNQPSIAVINQVINYFKTTENIESVILAYSDADILYYKFSPGLVKPQQKKCQPEETAESSENS